MFEDFSSPNRFLKMVTLLLSSASGYPGPYLKQCKNSTKAATPHGETRPFFFFFFSQKNNLFKYQTESINASIKFFFQEPGKWFFLFYRTGLKIGFLAEFLFYNQNNSRK